MSKQRREPRLPALVSSLIVVGSVATVLIMTSLGVVGTTPMQSQSGQNFVVRVMSTAPNQSQSGPNFIGEGTVCGLETAVASAQLWTPVILLNSPYEGNSTASSISTYQGSFSFSYSGAGSVTTTTSSYSGVEIGASDGASWGYFQLDTWSIYPTHSVEQPGNEDLPCTQSYVAEITSKSTTTATLQVLAAGTESDAGEPTSISHDGYNSVMFQNGYTAYGGQEQNCGETILLSGETDAISESLSPSVSFDGYSAAGSVTLTSSVTTAYSYPLGIGTYDYQSLDSSANDGALAFDYVSSTC